MQMPYHSPPVGAFSVFMRLSPKAPPWPGAEFIAKCKNSISLCMHIARESGQAGCGKSGRCRRRSPGKPGGAPWRRGICGRLPPEGRHGERLGTIIACTGKGMTRRESIRNALTRIIHDGSSRGGADGRGCKAREGRIPEAYSTVRRGIRPSATPQTCPDPPPQQKLHE